MNVTVARLTARGLLGRRRGLLLLALPVLLLALSALIRAIAGQDEGTASNILGGLALGTMVPLVGLVAGTGAIGPEIDDGSIIYLLSKPQPRWKIITSKLVVAIGCSVVFAALPTYFAGLILFGTYQNLTLGYTVAALIAGVAYSAIFLLLGVVSRHAVVWGLMYALLWETVVGAYVPGAQTLSVHQWALSIGEKIASPGVISSSVHLPTAVPLLLVASLGGAWLASARLTRLTLAGEE
ncbi:ABC transporter permease [Streptacidiphilus jiangxiensis]|uniref:ABC-2 type transport system permease protein n=1 Tax=Streptacidiphilus jiangxiensis TaxID=235985 RepID=A0A1H7J3M6_STRJI|nr:ABC transporter permease [Streptacidiphilus jiangxiensis]SEK69329.1 ABC-2 type transport system permease protein [Streptacidiphilus jiangxiensis]